MKPLILSMTALAAIFASDAALARTVLYHCADGSKISARFHNDGADGSVSLAFAGARPIVVPQAPSADGGRYVAGDLEFWIKGRSATLTRGGKATTCTTK